jgi:hypothetical protein
MNKRDGYENKRIENKVDVIAYLDNLQYALRDDQTRITFQQERRVDESRSLKHTNRYTMLTLFPDEDEVGVLKRELHNLKVEEYVETVKDKRFKNRSEMRVFARQYADEDVYIKIRVELLDVVFASGGHTVFVMSFHFAEEKFTKDDFPHRKPGCVK